MKRGTLAGLSGVLVVPRGRGHWIVQSDQVPRGVFVAIGESLLSPRSPDDVQ
jgi:hypothetical protein